MLWKKHFLCTKWANLETEANKSSFAHPNVYSKMQSLNNIVTWINESETQEDVFFQRNKTV